MTRKTNAELTFRCVYLVEYSDICILIRLQDMLRVYLLALLFCLPFVVNCQKVYSEDSRITEIGISLNLLYYSGDLAESRVVLKDGQFGFGFHVRRQLSQPFFLTLNGVFSRISGDDVNNGDALKFRKYRFFSPIKEFSLSGEWHPLKTPLELGATGTTLSPYVSLGGGVVLADPVAEYYGVGNSPFPEADQQKLFITAPIGFGIRAVVYNKVSVHGILSWKPVFSDKLDGVSVKGNPDNNDWYSGFQFGFSYQLQGPTE